MSMEFDQRVDDLKTMICCSNEPWRVPIPIQYWDNILEALRERVMAIEGKLKGEITVNMDDEKKTGGCHGLI